MDGDGREIEIKFPVGPVVARRMLAYLEPGSRPAPRTLTSVYFDTADLRLRRAGVTLRVREEDGQFTQTVKSRGGSDGRPGRGEWEAAVDRAAPDPELAGPSPAGGAAGEGPLRPLFTTIIRRRSILVERLGATIEVSFDRGEVIAGARTAPVSEVELELEAGDPLGLIVLAEELQGRFDLELSFAAKADRGFVLLDRGAARARHFEAPLIGGEMTVGEAFRAIARAALDQIVANATLIRSRPGAEAVHQLRVAIRRLRGALAIFAPILADERLADIEADLRWLAGELDPARNLDVLLAGAWRRAARRKSDGPGLARLGARLRSERSAARGRARQAAGGARFRSMMLRILSWVEYGPWARDGARAAAMRDAPARAFAARALRRARRKVERRGRRFARLNRARRHKVRIAAKRLRYAAEALGPLRGHPKRARRLVARLKALLEDLGDLNDIATGERLIGDEPAGQAMIAAERARERRLIVAAKESFDAFREIKT